MVVAQTVKLNEASIRTYDYDEQMQEIDGTPRRVWTFDILTIGQEDKESLNRLLRERELTLTVAHEETRVRKGAYSYHYEGANESPTTRYRYKVQLVELLEGEEVEDAGWGLFGRVIDDVSKLIFDLSIQRYEERLRAIEERLGVQNEEHIKRYEQKLDQEIERGWLKRWPELARGLREISQTPRVKELLASLPPEAADEGSGKDGES